MIINEDRVEIHGPFLMQKIRKEGIPVAGRKPKPTALKKLEGNPGKRKLNTKEPIPAKGMPNCPEWLLPEAKKEWERLADLMNQIGVLTEVDMAAFAELPHQRSGCLRSADTSHVLLYHLQLQKK